MRAFLAVLVTVLVAACGNKGPLYLPDTVAPATANQTPAETKERKRNGASS